MNEEDKNRNEQKEKHEKTKKKIKIVGVVLLVCGVVLDIAFFADFFAAFFLMSGMPRLIFCGFLGIPMTAIGVNLLVLGKRKEISAYLKNESVPVINEAAEELKPTIKAFADAARQTTARKREESVCPVCGKENQAENKYCDGCGALLYKFCPVCGARQEANDKFCGQCGAKFDD